MTRQIKISAVAIITVLVAFVVGIVNPMNFDYFRDDPLIEVMTILDDQVDKCKTELKTYQTPGEECRFMLNIGDRIFEGDARRWGQEMIDLGHLKANNVGRVNDSLRNYVDTMKVVAALLRHQADSLTHKSEMGI